MVEWEIYSHQYIILIDTVPTLGSKEDKYARRRRKRQEKVDLEVTEELAEISLEQEVLRELSVKPHQDNDKKKPTGKRTKQPISLSIADMITALEVITLKPLVLESPG